MAAYRKKAANDRDALFGGMQDSGGGKGSRTTSGKNSRDELFGNRTSSGGSSSGGGTGRPGPASRPPPQQQNQPDAMECLRAMKKGQNRQHRHVLQGEVRDNKIKEAMEYRDKGNKCMQKSFFSKPDPVAASTFYKRAADAYQQVGDMSREERLYRIQSAQCNAMIRAWASVAKDYTRATDLLVQQYDNGIPDETIANPAMEASSYHQEAANAWIQLNEKSKAAGSSIKAAIALNSFGDGGSMTNLSKQSLTAMEQAVETHVPDVLNPFRRYRQTGQSAFTSDDDDDGDPTTSPPSQRTLEFAQEHMVTAAYAHEPLQELLYMLVHQYREYPTALYVAGAASALLERDNNSTISLNRMYVTETILLLAMGDAVAAQEIFLNRHVQKDFYLKARECKLAEELFRSILDRNPQTLDEVRSPTGSNKAALANLHPSLRQLVHELRISGVARKAKPAAQAPGRGGGPPPGPPTRGGGRAGGPPARGGGPPPGRAGGPPARGGGRGPPPRGGGRGRGPPPRGGGRGPPPPGAARGRGGSQPPGQARAGAPVSAAATAPQDSTFSDLMKMKTGYEQEVQQGSNLNTNALSAELDDLDFGNDDDDDFLGRDDGGDDDDDDLEDLR